MEREREGQAHCVPRGNISDDGFVKGRDRNVKTCQRLYTSATMRKTLEFLTMSDSGSLKFSDVETIFKNK